MFAIDVEQRECIQCSKEYPNCSFSKSQWKKGPGKGRCLTCVGGNNGADNKGKTSFLTKIQQQSKPKKKVAMLTLSPSSIATVKPREANDSATLVIQPRPQMTVPGFPHLTVCTDWPHAKRGEPPAKQTAIFMPLLACVIGPVEGHCTANELETAMQWWAEALPAWPRWVEALKKAGVPKMRKRLLESARGQPTRLVPKVKGSHGTVPHCWGKLQSQALERNPEVAVEVYASVACLYARGHLNDTNK